MKVSPNHGTKALWTDVTAVYEKTLANATEKIGGRHLKNGLGDLPVNYIGVITYFCWGV